MVILVDPSDIVVISFDWTDALPTGVLVASVAHSVPSPLTLVFEATVPEDSLSTAKISGMLHGGTYQVQATATLDNGETINRAATIRCVDA
jgi:hypothetical protein